MIEPTLGRAITRIKNKIVKYWRYTTVANFKIKNIRVASPLEQDQVDNEVALDTNDEIEDEQSFDSDEDSKFGENGFDEADDVGIEESPDEEIYEEEIDEEGIDDEGMEPQEPSVSVKKGPGDTVDVTITGIPSANVDVEEDFGEEDFGEEGFGEEGMGGKGLEDEEIPSDEEVPSGKEIPQEEAAGALGDETAEIEVERNEENPGTSMTANLRIKNVRLAQSQPMQQTMPKESFEESKPRVRIPRNKAVGFDQVPLPPNTKNIKVYNYPYELGEAGSDTDIVPRDSSGDGLGGKKVTFERERAVGQTSNNPDNYVQTLNDVPEPTPAGSKDNHAVAESQTMKKLASMRQKLIETQRSLHKAEIGRDRERIARKIVQAEIDRGLFACQTDEHLEKRVATMLDTPTSVLNREFQRVKTYPVVPSVTSTEANNTRNSAITAKAALNRQSGFVDYGGVTLQSGIAAFNRRADDIPTIGQNTHQELVDSIQDLTYLGRQFPKNK